MVALKIISLLMLALLVCMSIAIMDQKEEDEILPISEIAFLLCLVVPMIYIALN